MRRRLQRQGGFTLVEAIIGMTILSAITIAMAGTFLVASRSLSNEARIIAADTAVSHASFSLTRDLASANGVPTGTISAGTPPNMLTLTYGSPPVTVIYSIDANNDLVRSVNLSSQVAARNIRSVVITAAGCYTTATIQPSATGASAVTLNVSNRPGGCF